MASVSTISGPLPGCEKLDIDSVKKICKSNQVMIYGVAHCKYGDVFKILDDLAWEGKSFDKVFNWVIANKRIRPERRKTYEGRDMGLINYETSYYYPQTTSRPCKTAITDLVLENYKRIEEGKKAIPLIFCIDIDGNPQSLTMKHIAAPSSQGITIKELRRAYKLCTHENPKIRRAAEETLKFVKMKYQGDKTYAMEQIPAPWTDANEAAKLWQARKSASISRAKEGRVNWRSQLEVRISEYEKTQSDITRPPILLPTLTTALPVALVSLAIRKASEAYENNKSEVSVTRLGDDS